MRREIGRLWLMQRFALARPGGRPSPDSDTCLSVDVRPRIRAVLSALIAAAILVVAHPGVAKDLTVSEQQIAKLGIELSEVRTASMETTASLPATVVPPLNGRIAAAAPYAGTVLRVDVLPGQTVRQGDPLIVIASRELLEAMSKLRQAEAELHAAEAVKRRMTTLAGKDIVARDRADEVSAQHEKATAVVEELRRTMGMLGIRINTDGSYTVVAPKAGRIYELQAAPGGRLEAMAAGALIDISEDLWVEAHVPIDLMASVNIGDAVKIKDGPVGRVVSLARALDPGSRSAKLLAHVDAGSGLMAGQMVVMEISRRREGGGLEVSSNALSWIDDGFVVFLRTPTGFSMQRVTVRGRNGDVATIEADLKPGQQLAASGLSELQKMAAGE